MKNFVFFLLVLINYNVVSQIFTRRDSLHGGLASERINFDIIKYDLNIKINPDEKSIVGYNNITFLAKTEKTKRIQLDLFENMKIDSIFYKNSKVEYKREFNAVFIELPNEFPIDIEQQIQFYYSGKPIIAKNAPWDGGFIFAKDRKGKHHIGVACQGDGASLWFPCKDSQSDEPDQGVTIKVAVPNGLINVSNGRLIGSEDLKNGYTRWDWEVKNPINVYNITVNIADYVHFGEKYKNLDLDYYVLRENEAKAKLQFEQVKPMMDCFQGKFGEYPFKEDGYKLVETPYLGMEHQSAVAYGNKFQNGYLGTDLSSTGVGDLFDFIIIHESGHEWFGNSITSKDVADMWIHEGFTCYSESVFVECQYGPEKAQTYINGLKQNVQNDKPIIGNYNVRNEGSSDMYYKGALMLNTIRSCVNNDAKWWELLLKFSKTYRHKIVEHKNVVDFFNKQTGLNLTPIFDQYLRHKNIPNLEIKIEKKKLVYNWKTNVNGFNMPIDIKLKGKTIRLFPKNEKQISDFKVRKMKEIAVLTDSFFVTVSK